MSHLLDLTCLRRVRVILLCVLLPACGGLPQADAGTAVDAGTVDAGTAVDAGSVDGGLTVGVWPAGATSFELRTGGVWRPTCVLDDGGVLRTRWEINLDAGDMAYDACLSEDGGFFGRSVRRMGARALTPAERTTLDSTIAGIRASSPTQLACGTDGAAAEIDVITAFGATVSLLDLERLDPPSCQPPMGRQLVSGGWALSTFLEGLVR